MPVDKEININMPSDQENELINLESDNNDIQIENLSDDNRHALTNDNIDNILKNLDISDEECENINGEQDHKVDKNYQANINENFIELIEYSNKSDSDNEFDMY